MAIRLTEQEFAKLVDQALASLPEEFLPYMENLSVEVVPQATRSQLDSAGLGPDSDLLGLYEGVPLTKKSVDFLVDWPERIFIFQRSIESICNSPQEVIEQVRTTVLHEVGHHFGMDEDDLDELGYG